jgi:hypothetical protein
VFEEIDHEIMPWPARFNPSQVRALYSTFPNVSGLSEPRRSEVLDALAAVAESEFGGLVERTFYTSIYIARRAWEAVARLLKRLLPHSWAGGRLVQQQR